ncbi:MAG: 4Fe-4S binding protein [Synergistaceae bacterium]|nr:4Fe-4S binding protein [Synergistaceae bacterium]
MRRKIIQLYSALLYNAHVKGFITGEIYRGNTKFACVPGLNCYSCPGAVGACPLGALQNALIASNHRIGYYVIGIILLYGVILGRTVCGWLCPMGLLQEIFYKIPTHKISKSKFTRKLSYLKYFFLALLVILVPLLYKFPGFCKYICPAGTLEGAGGLLVNPVNDKLFAMLGILFTSKFAIMIFIVMACVFCYRAFCRFICPLGAIYGLFNKFSVIGVKVDENFCTHCGRCINSCKMDVKFVGDCECINCGECIKSCSYKAISFKFSNVLKSRIICGLAIILLCAAMIFYNLPEPEKIAPVGHEIGERLENFEITCIDGTKFNLADNFGKVIIINLWATYCAPCVKELPFFDSLYRANKENLAVIAVHSSLTTEDPAEFLAKYDFSIKFAVDTEDDKIWEIVKGSATLPQTIVINRKGEIIYNQVGSVTSEMLAALYDKASK